MQIEIVSEVDTLVSLMRENPESRDIVELELGRKALLIFTDEAHLGRLLDARTFVAAKQKLIRDALEDLASGAPILMSSKMGIEVAGKPGEFQSFIQTYPLQPSSQPVIFSIELKDAASFRNLVDPLEFDFHELTANAAVYYLISLLASEASAT